MSELIIRKILEKNEFAKTIGIELLKTSEDYANGRMNYLLPVKDTKYVNCEAKSIRQGGTIGVYEAMITDDAGQVLATADFTYYKTKEKIQEEKK